MREEDGSEKQKSSFFFERSACMDYQEEIKHVQFDERDMEYYELLSKQFPTIKDVCTEIINLESILNLPKGTEHFMSDLHGEYDAFLHIMNNCSGVIKEKIKFCFDKELSKYEMEELATLVYYPYEKIKKVKTEGLLNKQWYQTNIYHLIFLMKKLSLKYTRSKVRKAIPEEYLYIIEELINERDHDSICQKNYQQQIIETIISVHMADDFIVVMTDVIKRLAVDTLHIIGDIYDRGSRPDKIIELLMKHHNVDIQWGNHDILWMGAVCGNEACIARVVRNCLNYHNEELLENSYAISLRALERYAVEKYPHLDCYDAMLLCISVILLKSEGALILKHPEYQMDEQLKLHLIKDNQILLGNQKYTLENISQEDCCYKCNEQEEMIMTKLKSEFMHSEKLHQHVSFLYQKGSMYLCTNNTLLYHGCVPLDQEGHFIGIEINGYHYKGKELFDFCDQQARKAYFHKESNAIDFMFYLWCGINSPLSGRVLKTFERFFINDEKTWEEQRNPYYYFYNQEKYCLKILKEFHMNEKTSHIINGHTPVKCNEKPLRANGKVIIIDGGFCKTYQKETGIAGYTLISHSQGLKLKSHTPFKGIQRVLRINSDIHSQSQDIEDYDHRMLVKDTDIGKELFQQMLHLRVLLYAYERGIIS
jgi:fructose-1,6-bisphosphatase-3